MIAKITVGTSLYGALAYNGQKVNEGEGRLLAVNRIFDDGSGHVDIARAEQDFKRFMPEQVRTRNKVIHISLNPHPDDRLTDVELEQLAREYLDRLGYGNQPYLVFKHEDISRHHLHIVSVNVDGQGRRLNRDFIHRRSRRITSELEKKYGLHPADRRQHRTDNPLRPVDTSQGDVRRQVSNVVKAVMAGYRFQTMGEYRALLSLYNVTVEEAHGIVNGREYHGLVYFSLSLSNPSATGDAGNRTGNPFKASRIGKSVGYEAVQRRFEFSKGQIRDKRLAEITRKTVAAALALQEHFTLPYAGTPPIPFTIAVDGQQPDTRPAVEYDEGDSSGLGLLGGDASGAQAEEAAFERDLRRRQKKRRKGQGL